MSKLLLTFYGDDFTGSTDALEQLTLAGIRTALFIEPPTRQQLARFKNLRAIGVAGKTRSLAPNAIERELKPALKKLKALGARHVHYKVCSTFDSSPTIGSVGRVMDVAAKIFPAPFIPLLVAAPALGRFTVFGNHFAQYGIGSAGAIHRLDRHPSVSKHPVTPMREADLRLHLARQTKKRVALFDILQKYLVLKLARKAANRMLAEGAEVILFDAMHGLQLLGIADLVESYARKARPIFWVGSSGVEMALGECWIGARVAEPPTEWPRLRKASVLIGSGSCSPVTRGQIVWALKHGFVEVPLNVAALATAKTARGEIKSAAGRVAKLLTVGRSVIVHTTKTGPDRRVAAKLKGNTAKILGTALGEVLRQAAGKSSVRRICIAGGDTSSYAAQAMGIEALEMIAPLTPGAPLCRAHAPGSPVDGREVVFKGGQVGGENYFEIVLKGKR